MCVCVSVCVMGVCKCVSHMRGNEIFIIGRLSSHGADWVQITRSGDKKKNKTPNGRDVRGTGYTLQHFSHRVR